PAALPPPHSFPTRRSSDLLPAVGGFAHHPKSFALQDRSQRLSEAEVVVGEENADRHHVSKGMATCTLVPRPGAEMIWKLPRTASDRKSTRLNSSHVSISYA